MPLDNILDRDKSFGEAQLIRHPKLRVYVMHAGWPMLNEMIALLAMYPEVYAEVAGIDWLLPRKEFHRYLRGLVEAGFGKRIMFGSDAAMWPQVIGIGIEAIESADFLTEVQKRALTTPRVFCGSVGRSSCKADGARLLSDRICPG